MTEKKDFITTYSKIKFEPLSANDKDINIIDIAHALSMICRANGHFKHFYSVAQHSINCAKEAKVRGLSSDVQLACLLHDASEAYIGDITRPIKKYLHKYLEIEEVLQNNIYKKYNLDSLTEEEMEQVFDIDDSILYYEFISIADKRIFDYEPKLLSKPSFEQREFVEIKNEFLCMFKELTT